MQCHADDVKNACKIRKETVQLNLVNSLSILSFVNNGFFIHISFLVTLHYFLRSFYLLVFLNTKHSTCIDILYQNFKNCCKHNSMLKIHIKTDRNWQELTLCSACVRNLFFKSSKTFQKKKPIKKEWSTCLKLTQAENHNFLF